MGVLAYVFLTLKRGGESNVANLLKNMNGVVDVSLLYGEYDLIAKVEKESMEDLQKFLTKEIRTIADVEQTSTMITVK
jgi:anthranilate phosphoribosyltransferase